MRATENTPTGSPPTSPTSSRNGVEAPRTPPHPGGHDRARPHVAAGRGVPSAGQRCSEWTACWGVSSAGAVDRSEEHTSELQSRFDRVCRLLLEKKKRHILYKSNNK